MIKGIEISNFNVLVPTSVWLQKEQTYFPIPKAMTLILPLGGFTNTMSFYPHSCCLLCGPEIRQTLEYRGRQCRSAFVDVTETCDLLSDAGDLLDGVSK
jgi:hypothetical protein